MKMGFYSTPNGNFDGLYRHRLKISQRIGKTQRDRQRVSFFDGDTITTQHQVAARKVRRQCHHVDSECVKHSKVSLRIHMPYGTDGAE